MTRLALPSVHASVSEAVRVAESIATEAGLSEEALMRVSLAVSEAVANAIEHGNRFDAHKDVRLHFDATRSQISVAVQDQGEGLLPGLIEAAALPDDPLDVGGRGLYLIRELADRVDIDGQVVSMVFRERL